MEQNILWRTLFNTILSHPVHTYRLYFNGLDLNSEKKGNIHSHAVILFHGTDVSSRVVAHPPRGGAVWGFSYSDGARPARAWHAASLALSASKHVSTGRLAAEWRLEAAVKSGWMIWRGLILEKWELALHSTTALAGVVRVRAQW